MKPDQMTSSLKDVLVPELKQRGFKGSMPHFRRATNDRIDLLTIQFDKWGGGFVIEISKCAPNGIRMAWGEEISPRKVTARDVNPHNRLRLGAPREGDHWFRFDKGFSTKEVAKQATSYLAEADRWWNYSPNWWQETSA